MRSAKKFDASIADRYRPDFGVSWLSLSDPGALLMALMSLSIGAVTCSIAISQIFLVAAICVWLYLLARGQAEIVVTPALALIGCFVMAIQVSALASPTPLYSLGYSKKFLIYSVLLIVPVAFRDRRELERVYLVIALGATLSAGVGIFQYFFDSQISLVNRISGLTGHWMTFSGLQMLSLLGLLALLAASPTGSADGGRLRGRYRWIYPAVPIQAFALALSQTRSAWLGFLAGLVVLALIFNRRWLLVILPGILICFLVMPQPFRERTSAAFDLSDSTTRIRMELVQTGWNMIQAHPLVGVGPRRVPLDYASYNTTNEFPSWIYQHLHNNVIQIGAEMGLPALLFWLAFLGALAATALRQLIAAPGQPDRFAAGASLASIAALLAAGLFEYNYGDSEVLTLFLFIIASPLALNGRMRLDTEAS